MGFITRARLTPNVTVSGGAAQSFFTSLIANGAHVDAIVFTNGTASGLSTAGHMTIVGSQSGVEVLNVTTTGTSGVAVWYYPRAYAVDTSNIAYGYSSQTTPPRVPVAIPIAQEALKVTITSAGNVSAGGHSFTLDFYLWTGG